MENVLFKISFPAEFHAQTAVECAMQLHPRVKERLSDIAKITIRTHESAIRIIDKQGPLQSRPIATTASRYMVAVPPDPSACPHASDYEDTSPPTRASTGSRAKMVLLSRTRTFSVDYHDPDKTLDRERHTVELSDGTKLKEVVVELSDRPPAAAQGGHAGARREVPKQPRAALSGEAAAQAILDVALDAGPKARGGCRCTSSSISMGSEATMPASARLALASPRSPRAARTFRS
jgi:2-methylcitrate dehydratase PrpD